MKIALCLPPKQRLAQDQYHSKPQTGIAYIAGGLRKDGIDLTIYNSKFENIFEDKLTTLLINGSYDIIGFSAMTIEIKSIGRIADRIKAVQKDCIIAVGGCHVNAIPKETMEEFPSFDFACIGEHEDQIDRIFSALYARDYDGLEKFDHIIFRRNGELHHRHLKRRFIHDLDSLAWPAYDLFGSKNLNPSYFTARGCPFYCYFCQQNSGRVIRKRDPIAVVDKIEYFTNYFNQKAFSFADESFTVNKKHTIAICNELIRRGLHRKVSWACETHSKVADYDLFCLMREAGCCLVSIGIESGSDEILAATGKGTTVQIIKDACEKVKRAKLKLGGLFILGHPFETKKSMLESISLGVRLNPDSITFSMMTPFPGTKVYEYASKNEAGLRLLTKNWEKYDNITGNAMSWDNFSVRTVKIYQALGLISYHLFNLRILKFLKYLNTHKKGIIAYFINLIKR
jgi:radical SAM superfamily enzyme YgiQ (UPF0313 family)